MLNLLKTEVKILEDLNISLKSRTGFIFKKISSYYFKKHLFRDHYNFFKRNFSLSCSKKYLSYMIFFNEYDINVDFKFRYIIIEILKYKFKQTKYIDMSIPIVINKINECQCSLISEFGCCRYCKYTILKNNNMSCCDLLYFTYTIFCDGNFSYKVLLDNLRINERVDVIKIILKKYYLKDLVKILDDIIISRKKDKLAILRSYLNAQNINIKYLCELSNYFVIDD